MLWALDPGAGAGGSFCPSCEAVDRRSGCSLDGLLWTRAVGVTLAPYGDARVMKTDDTILF